MKEGFYYASEQILLVNVVISHAQFETIHAYKDGNGRLGRAIMPIQMAIIDINVIVKDSTVMKKGYRYQRVYEVFIGTE